MAINLTCPKCGERMNLDLATTTVTCKSCGFKPGTGLDDKAEEIRAKGPRPNVSITNQDRINARAISLFYTAHDYLFQNDKVQAIKCLQSAIAIQDDFLDAHLWIARITDDDKLKREHLSSILAYDGGHPEATRMMLVMNGRLTPEQAALANRDVSPIARLADAPVDTETIVLRCPKCGGDLTTDDAAGHVECAFCGYTAPLPERHTSSGDLLIAALLERKSQPVRWVIDQRLLHCNNCGAEHLLTAGQLSARCPFCYSTHVIERDALDSFEQPEGLLPFTISREAAGERIKERLKGMSERIKGWFGNNKVARASLMAYYLPFWAFDAMVNVTRTRVDNSPTRDRARLALPYSQRAFQDAVYDLTVCAVKSPASALTRQLGAYNLRELLTYKPELLAQHPAELYTLDFDQAALEARSHIASTMRDKYGSRELTDDHQITINITATVQQMSFRLVLLPVWVATLVEEDKDIRAALVNGQTGRVILGKSAKAGS